MTFAAVLKLEVDFFNASILSDLSEYWGPGSLRVSPVDLPPGHLLSVLSVHTVNQNTKKPPLQQGFRDLIQSDLSLGTPVGA